MIERQRGEDDRLLDLRRHRHQRRVPGFHLQDIGDQIAMQQHRALGDAGGAAGVLQEGDVVGPDRRGRERQPAAGIDRVVEADCVRQVIGRHHLLDVAHDAVDQRAFNGPKHVAQAGDDHVLDRRMRQRLLQHRREVLQHHDRLGAGVAELEFQFARLVERVDVHHREAGAQDRHDRNRILQYVRHHHGDAGAALQAAALQPGSERLRGGVELAVAERLAHADAARARGVALEALLEQCRQRGIGRRVDVGGDARRIMPQPNPFHEGFPAPAGEAGDLRREDRANRGSAQEPQDRVTSGSAPARFRHSVRPLRACAAATARETFRPSLRSRVA